MDKIKAKYKTYRLRKGYIFFKNNGRIKFATDSSIYSLLSTSVQRCDTF